MSTRRWGFGGQATLECAPSGSGPILGWRVGFVGWLAALYGLLWAMPAEAAGPAARPWVAAVFPPGAAEGSSVPAHLPLLLQAHAVEYLVQSGRYSDLHVKQLQRMLEHDGHGATPPTDANARWQIAARLGADRAVFAELTPADGGWLLRVQAASLDKNRPSWGAVQTAPLPAILTEAVARGGRLLAEAVLGLDGLRVTATPQGGLGSTRSPTALAAYGRCYAGLVKQSFRVDSPVLLSPAELQTLDGQCKQAVELDPAWKTAQAARLFVQALRASADRQNSQSLVADLTSSIVTWQHDEGYQPFYFLAAYWLATCFISAERGAEVLRTALEHYPHSLMFHSALSRHLTWGDEPTAAVAAWRAYLALNPNSAYVRGGLSRALALAGQRAEALREAEGAAQRDPKDKEALIVLASRHIDLGAYQKAIDLLAPLVAQPAGATGAKPDTAGVPLGEVWLRLGYAYFKRQPPDLAAAEQAFHSAVAAASGPSDWKVRALAHADLADLYERRGDRTRAEAERQQARGTTGASLYVRRRIEGESLQTIAVARGQGAMPPPTLTAPAQPPSPPGPSRVKIEINLRPLLCIGTELCTGKGASLPPSEAGTVGKNRVEIGGVHSAMGSHNF
ncbi:MAG TPA: hypothetical protein PKI03_04775 [Pseudomonadota bacterium]|nr:hypothetical protein [Pseudomonadota bacterium]